MTRKWNKKLIIREFWNFYNKLGRIPKEDDFKEYKNYPLFKAIKRRFNITYTDFLEKKMRLKPNKCYWNPEKLKKEFKKLIKDIGHVPTCRELLKLKRSDLTMAIRRFYNDKYNKLIADCGFKVNNKWWSEKNVKKEILFLYKKLGRTPTEREMKDYNKGLPAACLRYFGGINNTIKSTGLIVNQSSVKNNLWKHWEDFIIKVVKEIYQEIEIHPRLSNNSVPDLRVKDKIIEIKLNVHHEFLKKDIKNYTPYSNKLEFWHLYGTPIINHPKVSYVGPDEISQKLINLGDKGLLKDFHLLKRGIDPNGQERLND